MRVAGWLLLVAGVIIVVPPLVAVASIPLWAPTIAAAACPSCYGMQRIAEDLYVDAGMPEQQRRELQAAILAAESKILAFFGAVSHRRIILACGDEKCETRLRGWLEPTGVLGFSYNVEWLSVVRLAPRGQNETIITHELTHVQVHEKIGVVDQLLGNFPAWFDEGLAVLISDDRRYFNPGETAAERCLPTPDAELPSKLLPWNAMARRSPWVYAKAVCQVMHWMETHGGKEGVLAAIADVSAGKAFPE
jgi:hypothetical protein